MVSLKPRRSIVRDPVETEWSSDEFLAKFLSSRAFCQCSATRFAVSVKQETRTPIGYISIPMPLFISSKKSYCPWKRDNLERVRRDEEQLAQRAQGRQQPEDDTSRKRQRGRHDEGIPLIVPKSSVELSPFGLLIQNEVTDKARALEDKRKRLMDPMKDFINPTESMNTKEDYDLVNSLSIPEQARETKQHSMRSRFHKTSRHQHKRKRRNNYNSSIDTNPSIEELRARRLERERHEQVRQEALLGVTSTEQQTKRRYNSTYRL